MRRFERIKDRDFAYNLIYKNATWKVPFVFREFLDLYKFALHFLFKFEY